MPTDKKSTKKVENPSRVRKETAKSAENYIFSHCYTKGTDSQPRKTSIVAALVRDRYAADALVILEHTPRRAARAVRKAVESAQANLLYLHPAIDPKSVVITKISVTAGSRYRRYVPASRGRALPFEKISSNIYVEVAGLEDEAKKKQLEEAEKKAKEEAEKKAKEEKAAEKKSSEKTDKKTAKENK